MTGRSASSGPTGSTSRRSRANATRRIPALEDAEFTRFLRAPESFTPDVNFCLGETAEVRNLFVAAGFNSQGIIYSPGRGTCARGVDPSRARPRSTPPRSTSGASHVAGERALPSRADEGGARPALRDALAEPPGDHGARHPAFPALRPPGGRGRVLRRAQPVGAPDVVRAARRPAGVRILLRAAELVPVRGRGAPRRAGSRGAVRPELVREDRGDGRGRPAACSNGCARTTSTSVSGGSSTHCS